jgi:hypothetical protein
VIVHTGYWKAAHFRQWWRKMWSGKTLQGSTTKVMGRKGVVENVQNYGICTKMGVMRSSREMLHL